MELWPDRAGERDADITDVGDADAPTEILVGSHLDVPRALLPFGARGVFFGDVTGDPPASTFQRRHARATGRAGAQPAIEQHEPFALREGPDVCAVERAILSVLAGRRST
jgi:hypothetical protein